MIFSVAAIIALALYPWWTFANHRPRSVNKFNQWEFEYINLHRYSWKETPNVGARFTLYRSYNQECPNGGSGLAMVLGGGSLLCGHVIPDEPVVCSAGIAFDGPPSPWKPTASWFTCDDQPRAVEGEKEISNERKEWLKWRVIDLEELDRKSLPEPKPGYAGALLFKSAKLQVVNGVPLKESNSITPRVKVYSAILTLVPEMFECGVGPDGIEFSCQFKMFGPLLKCPHGMFCSLMANVTEEVKTASEFKNMVS